MDAMSERPTLTITASCPTCKGSGKRSTLVVMSNYPYSHNTHETCPDCTDGTIRQAVSCAGCKWFDRHIPEAFYGWCRQHSDMVEVSEDYGCLAWDAREG